MNTIRNARMPEDIDALKRMCKAFFEFTPVLDAHIGCDSDSLVSFVKTAKDSNDIAVFVATVDDKPVGASAGCVYPHFLNKKKIVGQELFWWVDPEHRASNLGEQLHEALVEWAKVNGASAFMMVAIANERADRIEKLYKRKGYVPLERTYVRGI